MPRHRWARSRIGLNNTSEGVVDVLCRECQLPPTYRMGLPFDVYTTFHWFGCKLCRTKTPQRMTYAEAVNDWNRTQKGK